MPINAGLCSADGWELDPTCMDIPDGYPPEQLEHWRLIAAEFLYVRTGQRFGPSCPVTVRPCRKQCWDGFSWFWQGQTLGYGYGFQQTGPFVPYLRDGAMYNASLCGCSGACHCGPELCEVFLPGPIYDVVSVDVNGQTVDPDTYGILDGRFLVRSSDAPAVPDDPDTPDVNEAVAACWPSCQDMSLAPGKPNTFTVVYRTGVSVPKMGSYALSKLVEHYVKGCTGCGCGVSARQNLARMTRQGVDLEFIPADQLGSGLTGVAAADQFIAAYNPGNLPRAMRVQSPDSPRRPRVWYGPGAN